MRESIIRCSLLSIGILAMLLTAGAAAGRRDKVTLCHVPPGNPGNAHEIVVGEPAVKHHLRNHPGDSVGSCPAACNPDDCDDGNACTVDVCNADGTCDSSQPVTCDDGDVCTIDRCSPNSGCTHLPEPDCDDGPCCDPDQKPSCFGTINSGGATCCDDGTWACNAADGSDTCPGAVGPVCEDDACCDPGLEPGVGGNPFCFEGSTCCDDGSWRCNAADGSDTCPGSAGPVCDDDGPCCEPDQKPSCFGTINSGGATCCDDGTWACNAADGSDTCPGAVGPVCEDDACCDPGLEPGVGGNPLCFEGSTCCDDGSWRCNAADGSDTCPGSAGPVCDDDGPCCDPEQKPSCFGTINSGGATCCDDGTWACNAADGSDTCPGSAGPVCACDPSAPPGLPNACDGV